MLVPISLLNSCDLIVISLEMSAERRLFVLHSVEIVFSKKNLCGDQFLTDN